MKLILLWQTEDAYSHDKWSLINALTETAGEDGKADYYWAKFLRKLEKPVSCCGVRMEVLQYDEAFTPTLIRKEFKTIPARKRVEINKATAKSSLKGMDPLTALLMEHPVQQVHQWPVNQGVAEGGF